ncbi:MAG: NAD-dependent epimerase/dehydratase family protein [Anaerolineae bacterium]|nr:MAG: NAD-dependent epimerase/dehydratase family protein [Anaerolineae bacterium]
MDLQGTRVLVVGGAGLLGSHLVDQLVDEDVKEIVVLDNFVRGTRANLASAVKSPKVKVVEGSITDIDLLRRVMASTDIVFLLAALWLFECVENPRACVEVNVVGNYNIIELAHELGVKRIVHSSSASVYGDAVTVPMTEDHPFNNRTMYGASKIAVEQFLRAHNEMHGLSYVSYRYMNIYGPRMDYRGAYVGVIPKVLDRIDRGLRPIVFGDGSQSYDFVYVGDVARANILGAKSDISDEFFNVGTGIRTTINELVTLLLELTGSDLKPEYRPQEQMFVTHRVGSTQKAERLLGFRAEVPLREGLKRFIEWRRQDMARG